MHILYIRLLLEYDLAQHFKNIIVLNQSVTTNYTKQDILCLIMFNVVTTLPCSTLIFNSLTISLDINVLQPSLLSPPLLYHFFHILTNT
jgi:hypothetical protein